MNTPRRFINQIMPGETLDQIFLVRDKDLRTTKGGDLYIVTTLLDKTGSLSARMWKASESIYNSIPLEGFLHVKGRTEEYRGALQFVIDACRPFPTEKVNLEDFLAVTEIDIEAAWAELLEILRDVKDKYLRLLIKKFVEDTQFVAGFKRSPAAMQMHQAYIGGLLEHTLNLLRCAKNLLPLYPKLNADLTLTGIFLHDAGKMAELSSGTSIAYTDRGQLVGHLVIGSLWVQEKARLIAEEIGEAFPAKTVDLLQHLILSHHGQYEFGSPKLPAIPESFFIHYLDNLDAKLWAAFHEIDSDPDVEATFTGFSRMLDTRVYKGSREL